MKIAAIRKLARYCFIVSILAFFLFIPNGFAKDVEIVPSIGLKQEYNDNILYSRIEETADAISYIRPALIIKKRTELLKLSVLARADFLFYWEETDLNTVNQRYRLNGEYKLTERLKIKGLGSYVRDTTLDSQLEETGVVGIRQKRERLNARAGIGYSLSERSDMAFDYRYIKTDYERLSSVDTEFHTFDFTYNRILQNQKDTISVIPRFTYGTSDAWDTYNYSLLFGWFHPFSETLDLTSLLGIRNTRQEFKFERDDSDTWGGVADIKLRKRSESSISTIGFSQRLRPNSDGEILNVSRLYCDIDFRVYRRLGVGFRGSIYYSQLEENDPRFDDDRWYFDVTPSMFYQLTEHFRLRLAYSYSQEDRLDLDENPKKDRQRVWFSLDMAFPKKM